ncbi:MAG: hypothetical protein ACLU7D_06935 [Collinsella sp.]
MDLDAFLRAWRCSIIPNGAASRSSWAETPSRAGVVSTCSYEARRFGVHSAMASAEARRLCPQAIWTHGHFDRYREVSAQVMAILADETPRVERVSIDEAFIDITPGRFAPEDPLLIARRISDRVAALGVTAPLARLQQDGRKDRKRARQAVWSDHCAPRYGTAVFGRAARVRHERNRAFGRGATASHAHLHCSASFTRARVPTLAAIFGVNGERMRQRALGLEVIRSHQPPMSEREVQIGAAMNAPLRRI